jgi:hypothetical protein
MYFAVVHPIILFSLSLHINPQTVLNLQSCHIYAYIYIYLNIVLIFLFVICFDYIFDIDCLNWKIVSNKNKWENFAEV